MDDLRGVTESLLADRPGLEDDLRAVVAADESDGTWQFTDVPLDSGAFGELVDSGVVEEHADGYRLADRRAVVAALEGETEPPDDESSGLAIPSLPAESTHTPTLAAVAAVLATVVGLRSTIVGSVFTSEGVVLPGNDPYLYLYWVERVAGETEAILGVFDGAVMGEMAVGEPLLVATLSAATVLLGGQSVAPVVLASYPVVAAVVTAGGLYLVAVRLSGDRRIALAAVLLLATTPEHALRTAVGFADHHAFDTVWLVVTLLGLVETERAATDDGNRTLAGVLVAVGVTGLVLSWEAGVLLAAPVGLYVFARAAITVADTDTTTDAGGVFEVCAPVLAGVAAAGALAWAAHAVLGWHSPFVAATPTVLFLAGALVVVWFEVGGRLAVDGRLLAAGAAVVGVAVPTLAVLLSPGLGAELAPRLDFLLTASAAVESQSVFGSQFGSVFGPVIAFGFGFFVGVPYLLVVAGRVVRGDHLGWLPPVVSGAWFLVLTLLQVRFASELAPFLSLFAAVGVVHLAAVVDLTDARPRVVSGDTTTVAWRPSLPSRSTAASLLVLLLLVAGFGAVQTPVHVSKVSPEPTEVTTARWIDDYAEQNDLAYPDDYVLSQWGVNRLYNYHVNGESRSYRYAEAVYPQFLQSRPGGGWYANLSRADRDGFVVTRDADEGGIPPQSLYATLHERWGSASDTAPGTGHYRAVHATADGSIKVFRVVPGVTVTAPAPRSTETPVSTNVSVADRRVQYRRSVEAYRSGVVEVTLPYAGTYTVGNTTVRLSPDEVTTGDRIAAFDRSGATWTFENGSGRVAYETRGGHHARIDRGRLRVDDGTGVVDLTPDGSVDATNVTLGVESAGQFRLTTRFRTNESLSYRDGARFPRIALHGRQMPFRETDGYQLSIVDGRLRGYVGDGDRVVSLIGPPINDAEWHTATLVWDGSRVALVADGRVVDTATWRGPVTTAGEPVAIGQGLGGEIDYVRVRTTNVTTPNTNERAPSSTFVTA